jgi:dipeptidyl aminopeptidase/acylaminoacyl peptidase
MQDDVIDGVEALIKTGQVDPARICIVGASYGGYVALQGGAKRPDLFKCVVSRAGLSDLVRSQKWEAEVFDKDSPRYKYWLKSVGDPKADAARLIAASPVTYAADYQPPVLLMHGVNDWNVPLEQSKIMEKALTKAGKTVTLTEYPGGHSGWGEVLEAKALTEMVVFVDKYIGPKR